MVGSFASGFNVGPNIESIRFPSQAGQSELGAKRTSLEPLFSIALF